jgi:excisionase family DNA binding protein
MNYQVARETNGAGAPRLTELPIGPSTTGSERRLVAEPLLATAQEVAKLLKVSMRTLWRLRSAGKLPSPVRIGATVRWRLDDIKTWIAAGCPPLPARENDPRRK